MYKILIIEDEIKLRLELQKYLETNGYQVNIVEDFTNILEHIDLSNNDLILLDINLPNVNGEFLLKEIRKNSSIPIIMVTSKNTVIDELLSINYGADDFITKPYNPEILIARIERILTRINHQDNIIKFENITLNISKSIIENESTKVELSRNELKILIYLLENKGKILSRDEIINYLWDNEEYVDDNTLTVNINRLRNKIGELTNQDIIETRRGQGYIIL